MNRIHSTHSDKRSLSILLTKYGRRLYPPLLAIFAALLLSGVVMLIMGYNPQNAYLALIEGAFGNMSAIGTTISKSLPLIIGGMGVIIAYRAEVFNIGVEGQMIMGGIFTCWVATRITGLPSILHIPLALAAGTTAGSLYALLPAWLKAKRNINEVIVTLLLNYVAELILGWAIRGPLNEPGVGYARSSEVLPSAQLPILIPEMRFHPGLIIAVAVLLLGYFFMWHTVPGFKIRYVGANKRAAEASGVNLYKTIMTATLLSGAISGLAGSVHLLGTDHRLFETFLDGFGYDAIAAATVGQLHPLGLFLGGLFFGSLRSGSNNILIEEGIPSTLIYVIQAFIILFVLASYHVRFGLRWWKRECHEDLESSMNNDQLINGMLG